MLGVYSKIELSLGGNVVIVVGKGIVLSPSVYKVQIINDGTQNFLTLMYVNIQKSAIIAINCLFFLT